MIDPLGHPIEVGHTVLIEDYKTLATVLDFNECFVILKPNWAVHKDLQLFKIPSEVLVINTQLEFNKSEYPENLI